MNQDDIEIIIGSKVLVLDIETNEQETYKIIPSKIVQEFRNVNVEDKGRVIGDYIDVLTSDADPFQGIISDLSPLGLSLLGKTVGDLITVKVNNTQIQYKILKVSKP